MRFNDVPIVSIAGNGYRIYFWYISQIEAVNLQQNSAKSKAKISASLYDIIFLYRD